MKKLQRKARKLSSLEAEFVKEAKQQGLPFEFEVESFEYIIKSKYTPDFKIAKNVFIETKGLFDSADRRKMKAFKAQYPFIHIHMLFGNSKNKIRPASKTTYAMWCKKQGIPCSDIKDGLPISVWPKKGGYQNQDTAFGH